MEILERLRDLLTPEDDLPSTDRIKEVRQDAMDRLEAAEAELEELRRSRADAVLEGDDAAEAHEAREEELEREIERLEAVRERLGEKLDQAETREKLERVEELADGLAPNCRGIKQAKEQLAMHRSEVASALKELSQLRAHLVRHTDAEIQLSHTTIAQLRQVVDDVPGNFRQTLKNLTPPQGEPDHPSRRIVIEVANGRRRFEGAWSDDQLRREGFRGIRYPESGKGDVLVEEPEGAS